jgi:quinohemoprotein ethanol dehydrogenase
MDAKTHASFPDIVLKGIRSDRGMASFARLLSPDDVEAIHGYIVSRAQEDWGHQNEHQ